MDSRRSISYKSNMNNAQQLSNQWAQTAVARPGRVRIEGDELIWSHAADRGPLYEPSPTRPVAPDVRALELFVRLADGSNEEILSFATRFGVLYICEEHGLPQSHYVSSDAVGAGFHVRSPDLEINDPEIQKIDRDLVDESRAHYVALYARGFTNRCRLTVLNTGEYSEPLGAWRYYARQARALLSLAGDLRAGEPGKGEDWEVFYGFPLSQNSSLSDRKWFVSLIVDEWLELGGVRPHLTWADRGCEIAFGSRTLFGTLATQLLLTVATDGAIAICASCGRFFRPVRHPRPGQQSYCREPTCGHAAAVRSAARRYQRRRRQQNRTTEPTA